MRIVSVLGNQIFIFFSFFVVYITGEDFVDDLNFFVFTSTSESRMCIIVDIVDDSIFEGVEFFSAHLDIIPNVDRVILDPAYAVIEISDDDCKF